MGGFGVEVFVQHIERFRGKSLCWEHDLVLVIIPLHLVVNMSGESVDTLPHRMKPEGKSDKKCDLVGHMLTGASRSSCRPDVLSLSPSDRGSIKGLP